jgi:ankyrin repeat protein
VNAFDGDVNARHSGRVAGAWGSRQTALFAAVQQGHTGTISALAAKGADVEQETGTGESVLCQAAWYPNESLATLLQEYPGVDVNVPQSHGDAWLPLFSAAWNGVMR